MENLREAINGVPFQEHVAFDMGNKELYIPPTKYREAGKKAAWIAHLAGKLTAAGHMPWRACFPWPDDEKKFGCSYCCCKPCECHKSTVKEHKVPPPPPSAARKAKKRAKGPRKVRWAKPDLKTYDPLAPVVPK